MTLQSLLRQARLRLEPVSETAVLDAQVLLAHLLNRSRAWVLAHPEASLQPAEERRFEAYVARLEQGEPLPYVLGEWEFYNLIFRVTPAVLIPRPETELLVGRALEWLRSHPGRRTAADVGTGSGCIAISLAVNVPDLQLTAADVSPEALQVAQQNVERHGVAGRVALVEADLLPAEPSSFDLICANLPYIPASTLQSLPVARWEPHLALYGGTDGLDVLRRLLRLAPERLAPGGLLLLEIEASQGAAARDLARQAFPDADAQVMADLAGRDRLVSVQRTG